MGGGRVGQRRDRRADLATRAIELQATAARRQDAIAQELHQLFDRAEDLERSIALAQAQAAAHRRRVELATISYQLGDGSTEAMQQLWQRTEELEAAIAGLEVQRDRIRTTLDRLCGDLPQESQSPPP